MKKNKGRIVLILLILLNLSSIQISAYAHSGRTDSSGGHRDNKNKSGLGSYHYHCGGHPPHLHTNGVCPYASSSSSSKNNTSNKSDKSKGSTSNKSGTSQSSTSNKSGTSSKDSTSTSSKSSSNTSSNKTTNTTTKVPTTIEVTGIQINESINSIKVGESKKITAIITPDNATNKNITWKTSDENIAKISAEGEIIAKKDGIVDITATSSNGKTSTIKVNVKGEPKVENNTIINTAITNKNNVENNSIVTGNGEDANPLGGALMLGLLGGGGYLIYSKGKKKNNQK